MAKAQKKPRCQLVWEWVFPTDFDPYPRRDITVAARNPLRDTLWSLQEGLIEKGYRVQWEPDHSAPNCVMIQKRSTGAQQPRYYAHGKPSAELLLEVIEAAMVGDIDEPLGAARGKGDLEEGER